MTKKKLCKFCGGEHGVLCPSVKAVEYFPSGKVKRVEFKCAGDFAQPSGPQWPTYVPPIYTPTMPVVVTN